MGATTTNGDGFGVGWYDEERDAERLPEHASGVERPQSERARGRDHRRRSSSRTSARRPARRSRRRTRTPSATGSWLWMHNGLIREFPEVQPGAHARRSTTRYSTRSRGRPTRRLMFVPRAHVRPRERPCGRGRAMVGVVEEAGERHEIENPIQMTSREPLTGTHRSGRSATRARATRGRSVTRTRNGRVEGSDPTSTSSRTSRTRRGWSSRSRSETSRQAWKEAPESLLRDRPAGRR